MLLGQEISIYLVRLIDDNLTQLKKLNDDIFSRQYSDRYYADALASGELTKLAYHNYTCVGAIACRCEKKEDGAVRVYIMTLGVLAPYRRLGIGTRLMNHVLDLSSKENISEVYLHVVADNGDAINFYKKFGFEKTETIGNYYRSSESGVKDGYVFTKRLVIVKEQEVPEGKDANTDKKCETSSALLKLKR
ncbi:N-alpha-acetyltransferase 50-like [Neltuma alba]|uniref:N-alpha-acetyltransferase 50-like n=1 Tax=Neltuma alba TaxID=207710 RepID=UPI0010A50A3C|nr:N-alpha-acetyltransferase 50-like [Prosopis alba]